MVLGEAYKKVKTLVKNSFEGATYGSRSAVSHKEVNNVDSSISANLSTLRARSVGAWINSPVANAIFDEWVSTEIGSSAKIRPTSSNDKFNEDISNLWKKHERFLDVGGNMNLLGILTVCTRERRVRGEVFIRLINRKIGKLPCPMQIQVLPSNSVPLFDKDLSNGNKIRDGIEYKGATKVAVHFYKADNSVYNLERVPISKVIHAFDQKFAGQRRGIPSFSPSMLKESEYNSYEENKLNRKASQSGVVGMITKDIIATGDDSQGLTGYDDPEDDNNQQQVEPEDKLISFGVNKLLIGEAGENLTMNNSPDVGQNYEKFTKNNQRLVSIGAGVPYSIAMGDFSGMNDRTLRQINNMFRRRVNGEKERVTNFQIVAKLWRWFIDAAVLSGVRADNYFDNRDDYRAYHFNTEAHAYDHATQDLTAVQSSINIGLESVQGVSDKRGSDWKQALKEKAEYKAEAKKVAEANNLTLDELLGD